MAVIFKRSIAYVFPKPIIIIGHIDYNIVILRLVKFNKLLYQQRGHSHYGKGIGMY